MTFRVVVPDDRALGADGEVAFQVETIAPPTGSPEPPADTVTLARTAWEEAQQQVRSLTAERTAWQEGAGRMDALAAELEAARDEADRLRDAAARVDELEVERARLAEQLESVQAAAPAAEPTLPDGIIAVAAAEWEQLQADLRELRDREPVAPAVDASLQVELESARSEAAELREKLSAAEAAAEQSAAQAASVAELEEENRLLVAGHEQLARQIEKLQAECLRREVASAPPELPESSIAVERDEWERLQATEAALQAAREELDSASTRAESLSQELEAARAEQEALRAKVEELENAVAGAQDREHEAAALIEERDSVRADLERATAELAAAGQAEERLGRLASELDELRAERDRLADEIPHLREQVAEAETLRERLGIAEAEHGALRQQHASQASLADELRRAHEEARERHDAARADWEREREELLRHAESQSGEQRARLETELAEARSELERVRGEADEERGALTRQVGELRAESDRWKDVLQTSARRIEQLVRDQEAQIRQRREVESALQRLEEAQREELALAARTHGDSLQKSTELSERNETLAAEVERLNEELAQSRRAQDELAAERARAVELLHESQTEQARHIHELERQLDDAVCAKAEFAPESDETIQVRADLVSAREKIKELTELLEASEEERMNIQATLRTLGIRVH